MLCDKTGKKAASVRGRSSARVRYCLMGVIRHSIMSFDTRNTKTMSTAAHRPTLMRVYSIRRARGYHFGICEFGSKIGSNESTGNPCPRSERSIQSSNPRERVTLPPSTPTAFADCLSIVVASVQVIGPAITRPHSQLWCAPGWATTQYRMDDAVGFIQILRACLSEKRMSKLPNVQFVTGGGSNERA